jgi:hypothetical protein
MRPPVAVNDLGDDIFRRNQGEHTWRVQVRKENPVPQGLGVEDIRIYEHGLGQWSTLPEPPRGWG